MTTLGLWLRSRRSDSALVTVTVLGEWLRLREVSEKLTGTRLTLVPSLRSAPTRDRGELVSVSWCREWAGVVFTPDPGYWEGAETGGTGAGAGAVWSLD